MARACRGTLKAEAQQSCPLCLPAVQLSVLTRLDTLVLEFGEYTPEGYDVCTTLPSLRHLELTECTELPACLSQLTGLQHLVRRCCSLRCAALRHIAWPKLFGRLRVARLLCCICSLAEPARQLLSLCRGWIALQLTPGN